MATTRQPYNSTYALAQFLATTGPEEYQHKQEEQQQWLKQQQQQQGPKFFDWLRRKQPSTPSHKSNHSTPIRSPVPYKRAGSLATTVTTVDSNATAIQRKKHIPLLGEDYRPFGEDGQVDLSMRRHGSLDASTLTGQAKSSHTLQQLAALSRKANLTNTAFNHSHMAMLMNLELQDEEDDDETDLSAAFPTPPSSSLHGSVKKKRSVSNQSSMHPSPVTGTARPHQHSAVQTEQQIQDPWATLFLSSLSQDGRCRLCCQAAPPSSTDHRLQKDVRRKSCPPALASGGRIKFGQEASALLALIEQLKQQLAEEQQSRKLLEQAFQAQQLFPLSTSQSASLDNPMHAG
ncbi:hypothetical protein DM01DRAFT_1334048 [Hesseltinella vesiculosa]|uniref:Uncharacterized protein n=1 Tax=Hesseltinella vesiculosa TaxID=101127 RepID=A0A1X2GMP4_9FUNG|nr:hypothetical protein DM01DRAFT_1334048 [Hesseltinella vesiculosa]